MTTGIPRDLISQIRISLRREANLSSYDPGDVTLSSFPSTADAIAELDPSPPYLRCKHCKGALMRGIDSLLCVFCGKQQRTSDNPPDNMKFTSTAGYGWLLDSLHLNGSEMVEMTKEADGKNREPKSPAEVIPLSKVLDLEIQWRPEEENSTTRSSHRTPAEDKVPLNLGGLDLDSFFIQENQAADVQPAQDKPNDIPVDDDFNDPRTLSLFENVDATGSNQLQQPENIDFFDKQVGEEHVSSERKDNTNNSEGKDTQANLSSLENENLSLFEGNGAQQSSSAAEEAGHHSLFQSLQPSEAATKSLENKIGDSSHWEAGFISAGKQTTPEEQKSTDPFMGSPAELSVHMDTLFEPGKDFFGAKPSNSAADPESNAGEWFQGDFISSVTQDEQQNSSSADIKDARKQMDANGTINTDWKQDDIWQTSTSIVPDDKATNDNDDEWNEFTASSYSEAPNSSFSKSGVGTLDETTKAKNGGVAETGLISPPGMNRDEDEMWQIGSTTVPAKIQDQTDDPFGTWNDFTGSNISQVPSVSHTQHSVDTAEPSVQQSSDINMWGAANDQHGFDFGGFSKPDFFSGVFSNQKNSSVLDISDSDRAVGTVDKDGKSDGDSTTNDILGGTSEAKTDNDAEKLLSQMHDLSFMLEDKLSVPSNPKQ